MPTNIAKKTEQDFADAAHQSSLAWARLKTPELGKAWSDEAREAAAAARAKGGKEKPTILHTITRSYGDNGQTTHYVHWSDGSRTEGPEALMSRAQREGAPHTDEKW